MSARILHVILSSWDFITTRDFLVSFFSSLFSTLLVAGLSWLIVYCFTNIFHMPQPNLTMVVKQDGLYSDSIKLTKEANGTYTANFQLAIKNQGDLTLKSGEGFWHTYINATNTPVSVPNEPNHQRGVIDYPIYPHSFTDISVTYNLTISKVEEISEGIPYFFATNYGYFPKTVVMDQKTGMILFKTMGLIKFNIIN